MLIRIAIFVCALVVPRSVLAGDLSGTWAAKSEGAVIYQFNIGKAPDGAWTATWDRPAKFNMDGESFSQIAGPVEHRKATMVVANNDELELTFDDSRPGSLPDVFKVRQVDENRAAAVYVPFAAFGLKVEPFLLVRDTPHQLTENWTPSRTYRAEHFTSTSAEMSAIFDADQASRQSGPPKDLALQNSQDQQRRIRTGELLDQGLLHSADDFYHAAFVYQHGNEAADYLKAHILATAAVALGKTDAKWIAAATLDRYLMAIGRPQVFGTQYMTPKGGVTTQEPFDRTAISDALRSVMNVPSLGAQAQTLIQMQGTRSTAKP